MLESVEATIVLLGVLSLGVFVGFIFGWVLSTSANLNIKVATAIISAALAGGPVMFMEGLGHEKWMYPIGLLLGLAWIRAGFSARLQVQDENVKVRVFAWFDIAAVIGATLIIYLCATFVNEFSHA